MFISFDIQCLKIELTNKSNEATLVSDPLRWIIWDSCYILITVSYEIVSISNTKIGNMPKKKNQDQFCLSEVYKFYSCHLTSDWVRVVLSLSLKTVQQIVSLFLWKKSLFILQMSLSKDYKTASVSRSIWRT